MLSEHRVRCERIIREAEGYLELGLPHLALNRLEQMKDPRTFRGHQTFLIGEALRSLHRYEQAVDALEEATDLNPSNVHAWLTLGWCLKRSRRLDQAIVALERAREMAPEEAIVHYNLACYYSLAHRKLDSLASLQRAIEIQPDFRDKIGDEHDFDPLRADPDFQALTSIIV